MRRPVPNSAYRKDGKFYEKELPQSENLANRTDILRGLRGNCGKCRSRTKAGAAGNKIETTATGRVSATIVAPVSAESANDLTFGMMVKNNQGKVTVDEDGNRTTTGPGLATSSYSAGSVKLKGPKAQAVTVDIPDARIYNNEDKSIDIHSFTTDAGKGNIVALDRQNGEATVDVGATLNIKDKETQGGSRNGVYILQTSY